MAYCCDSFEEILGEFFCGAGEGLSEDDLGGWLGFGSVETLDANRHGGKASFV